MADEGVFRSRYVSAVMPEWRAPAEADYEDAAANKRRQLRGWLPGSKDAVICDVGCGPGALLYMLRGLGYTRLSGADLSPECVELARRVCPEVEQADATEYLVRHRAEFDLVCMTDVIEHHAKDRLLPLLEAARDALRPGGRIIIQTPNAASPFFGRIRYGDVTHESALTPRSLTQLLRAAGFDEPELRECGPRPHGPVSLCRWLMWKVLRRLAQLWLLVETGGPGEGVYTQVMLARAQRQDDGGSRAGGATPAGVGKK
jgi:SAM-dependent methyltransferase